MTHVCVLCHPPTPAQALALANRHERTAMALLGSDATTRQLSAVDNLLTMCLGATPGLPRLLSNIRRRTRLSRWMTCWRQLSSTRPLPRSHACPHPRSRTTADVAPLPLVLTTVLARLEGTPLENPNGAEAPPLHLLLNKTDLSAAGRVMAVLGPAAAVSFNAVEGDAAEEAGWAKDVPKAATAQAAGARGGAPPSAEAIEDGGDAVGWMVALSSASQPAEWWGLLNYVLLVLQLPLSSEESIEGQLEDEEVMDRSCPFFHAA